jgi:uncharacterized protein HemX
MYWSIARYALAGGLGFLAAWQVQEWRVGSEVERIQKEYAQTQAEQARLVIEQSKASADKAKKIIEGKNREIESITSQYDLIVGELRQRSSRVSDATHCKGTTGAELSREDAEFLAGEAARADKLRSALNACYQQYEAMYDNRRN